MIYPRTIECKEKGCELDAHILSHHDVVRRRKGPEVIDYNRTTKYRCHEGHLSETTSVITEAEKYPPIPATPDHSPKRFHRKGFKGHEVKHHKRPTLVFGTNHERHLARKALRNMKKKEALNGV